MKSEIRKIQVDITKPQYPRFRSVFPPYFIKKAIPKELLDKVIKKSIENSKLSRDEKKVQDQIFFIITELTNNLSLLRFKIGNPILEENRDSEKKDFDIFKETEQNLNIASKYFDKEIQIIPYAKKKISEESIDLFREELEKYKNIITILLRLMRTAKVSTKYYQDNHKRFFDKYLKFNTEQTIIINDLFENIKKDVDFNNDIKKVWSD